MRATCGTEDHHPASEQDEEDHVIRINLRGDATCPLPCLDGGRLVPVQPQPLFVVGVPGLEDTAFRFCAPGHGSFPFAASFQREG